MNVKLISYSLIVLMAAVSLVSLPSAFAHGAGKASLWNTSSGFTCAAGATDFSNGPYGFVVMNTANGNLIVEVSLKGATPHATYDIWVNQNPGACPLSSPTAPSALTTNGQGNGNAHVVVPLVSGATSFWVSAVGGGQVLRSTAVSP